MRDITRPECGWWLIRLVKDGPEVPAAILYLQTTHAPSEPDNLIERPGCLCAFIAGQEVPTHAVWEVRGRAITEAEYKFRIADMRWCEANAPHEPTVNPTERIDLLRARIPF